MVRKLNYMFKLVKEVVKDYFDGKGYGPMSRREFIDTMKAHNLSERVRILYKIFYQ